MKSATLTIHICSSGCVCLQVSYRLHNLRIFVFHLNWFIWKLTFRSLQLHLLMSVRQIYTEFCVQVHRDWDRKCILFAFIYFLMRNVLFLLWVHKSKLRVFTDLKDLLLLSMWAKMREYFKSKWVHRCLHLSCSERYRSDSTLRTDTWTAHISLD